MKRKRWTPIDKIKNISVGTDKTPPPKKEEKKSKHQDLFDELLEIVNDIRNLIRFVGCNFYY